LTPDELRDLLVKRLDERWGRIREFDDAYNGTLTELINWQGI